MQINTVLDLKTSSSPGSDRSIHVAIMEIAVNFIKGESLLFMTNVDNINLRSHLVRITLNVWFGNA